MSLLQTAIADQPVLISVSDEIIARMSSDYMGLRCNGHSDTAALAVVSAARKECRNARKSVEATHKEMKAEVLERGRKLDGEKNRLLALIAPIEKHLADQEDSVKAELERIANAEKEKAIRDRMARLSSAGLSLPEAVVRLMNGIQFETEFQRAATEATARKNAEAALAVQQAELQKLRDAENERQLLQAIENKAAADKLKAERDALDKQRAEQQQAQQAIDKAARDAELIRVAEQTRIETEERLRRQATKKTEQAATEAANRGDRQKILDTAAALRNFELPAVKSDEAMAILTQVRDGLEWAARLCEGVVA